MVRVTVCAARVTGAATAGLMPLLSPSEQAQAARFLHGVDRDAYVAAHGLLRLRLAVHLGRAARDLSFADEPGGRPRLTDAPRTGFSLSHTRGLVAVAVCDGADIGVDAEADSALPPGQGTLHPEEERALAALPSPAPAFARLWTRKEAVAKALGLGLRLPFAGFDARAARVDPGPGLPQVRVESHVVPGYALAVAVVADSTPVVDWTLTDLPGSDAPQPAGVL